MVLISVSVCLGERLRRASCGRDRWGGTKLVFGRGDEKGKRQGRRVIGGGRELRGAKGLDGCEEAEWGGQYLMQGGYLVFRM